ncbi:MAG: hypothetical protein GY800_04625 [Planctomycetes bacterium]|nr:hypothetical protein [Planctomycetota bacterium]
MLGTPKMTFKRKGKTVEPLKEFKPDNETIVAVYQGALSRYDILIRYRQKDNTGKWSRIRTPKHIHWAVDLLIKMHTDKAKIQEFLDFLIEIWNKTIPFNSDEEREEFLDVKNLLEAHKSKIEEYQDISNYGEYRIEFLILLAKLLMVQEKTNMADAYMFKKLLETMKKEEGIFSIVSIATHTGRK